MSTEQLEILHDLIDALLGCQAWPIVKQQILDSFDDDEKIESLMKALEELSGRTGLDMPIQFDELRS